MAATRKVLGGSANIRPVAGQIGRDQKLQLVEQPGLHRDRRRVILCLPSTRAPPGNVRLVFL